MIDMLPHQLKSHWTFCLTCVLLISVTLRTTSVNAVHTPCRGQHHGEMEGVTSAEIRTLALPKSLERRKKLLCRCPRELIKLSFKQRYDEAHAVTRAKVLRSEVDASATFKGRIPQQLFRTYKMKTLGKYNRKGPSFGDIFVAQGFVHPATCGIVLEKGVDYLFFFDNRNPDTNPRDIIWRDRAFVIDRCMGIVKWKSLSKAKIRFLHRKRKWKGCLGVMSSLHISFFSSLCNNEIR